MGKILVRPTLSFDLNGDGVVDDYDISIFNAYGLYNTTTQTDLGWQAEDLNGDRLFDDTDILILNAANVDKTLTYN